MIFLQVQKLWFISVTGAGLGKNPKGAELQIMLNWIRNYGVEINVLTVEGPINNNGKKWLVPTLYNALSNLDCFRIFKKRLS